MDKKKYLLEINSFVEEIMVMVNTTQHKTKSLVLNGIQRVSVGYGGEIVEIDTNNMVQLEFEDYVGTTDWLPLGIFDEHTIKQTLAHLVMIKTQLENEQKDVVYSIIIHNSKGTKDVHLVCHTLKDANKELKTLQQTYESNPNVVISVHQKHDFYHAIFEDGYNVTYKICKSKIK